MSKKLKLSELKVQSFLTSFEKPEEVKGGTYRATDYSCYRYVSCVEVQCTFSLVRGQCADGPLDRLRSEIC